METTKQTALTAPQGNAPLRCTGCGQTMAADQKYCLGCGRRKGEPRVDFNEYMADGRPIVPGSKPDPAGPPPALPPRTALPPADDRPEREVTPLMAAASLVAFAIILLLGVTIGRLGGDSGTPQVVATTGVPATTATPTTGATAGTDVTVSFEADWPAGKEGWTIEIATLSKTEADPAAVEATQADLAAKGAPEVGVLDSDEYASLPTGNYVFYSGVFDSKAEATEELTTLSASFPEARIVEVATSVSTPAESDTGGSKEGGGSLVQEEGAAESEAPVEASTEELEDINDASAEEFQEIQDKLPPTIETEGEPPPKDDKAPGGGSGGAVEIG